MKEQKPQGGRIINNRQRVGEDRRGPELISLCPTTATKFALQGMTHQLTMDGRKHNIVASIFCIPARRCPHSRRGAGGRTKAGYGDKPGDDYIMAAEGRSQGRAADGGTAGRGEFVRGRRFLPNQDAEVVLSAGAEALGEP